MVDLLSEGPTPYQSPTLSELQEARAYVQIPRQHGIEWLMTTADEPGAPDVDALMAEFVNRPAWHKAAACRGADLELFFPLGGDAAGRLRRSPSARPAR